LGVSKDNTGNVSIDQAGWAGGKSVGELWGDVFSEVRTVILWENLLTYN
jgi:hypothetical protein